MRNLERMTDAMVRSVEIQAEARQQPPESQSRSIQSRQSGTGGTVHYGPWAVPTASPVPIVSPDDFHKSVSSGRYSGEYTQVSSDSEVPEKTVTSNNMEVASNGREQVPELLDEKKASQSALDIDLDDIFGMASEVIWRPKKFIKNPDYPKVAADGFYFERRAGGFALREQSSGRYVSFYTYEGSDGRDGINELEKRYAKHKTAPRRQRKTKSQDSRGRSPGGSLPDASGRKGSP